MTFHSPVLFQPHFQTRVWGGRKLETLFGKSLPNAELPYGESWEISDREEVQSPLLDDPQLTLHDLWQQHREAVFGKALTDHPAERFPLLLKILDATDDLSIQVHPPADVAARLGGEPKTEMWYVAHAEPGARLYVGLKPGTTQEDLKAAIQEGTVASLVPVLEPKAGDCLFIPSGRLHAIGKGLVIYEIQQNSDTTYRVFDWNRLGLDGQPRALHLAESLASIHFQDNAPDLLSAQKDGAIVQCPEFDVRLASEAGPIGQPGEFVLLIVAQGELHFHSTTLIAGTFALLPACLNLADRNAKCGSSGTHWLEIRLPALQ